MEDGIIGAVHGLGHLAKETFVAVAVSHRLGCRRTVLDVSCSPLAVQGTEMLTSGPPPVRSDHRSSPHPVQRDRTRESASRVWSPVAAPR